MVRLRREIEGIHVDRAVPLPPWADDAEATAAIAPALDEAIVAYDAQRVLIAGLPRLDLAAALVRAGRLVTVCDLDGDGVAAAHSSLPPEILGRLQLADKTYGNAAFAPSSFDLIAYFDTLSVYDEPLWLAHKMARELKVDGVLMARLWAAGPLPALSEDVEVVDAGAPAAAGAVAALLRAFDQYSGDRRLAALLYDARGRDAADRGAWRKSLAPRHDLAAQIEAIDARLRVERVEDVGALRPRLAALAAHGRGPLGRAASRALAQAQGPLAAPLRDADQARIVTVVARRALGDRRLMAGRLG